ncbi:MAG: acylphosphatase, partial [Thiotrichales bacterium]
MGSSPMSSGEHNQNKATPSARRIVLSGNVQGVGFRPFIYRTATRHRLSGWVRNRVGLVEMHVQGQTDALEQFVQAVFSSAPPLARPEL